VVVVLVHDGGPLPRAMRARLARNANGQAIANPTSSGHQNRGLPSPASIAPGTSRMNPLSIASMIAIDTVSDASAVLTITPTASPARINGTEVSAYPNRNASAIASAMVAPLPSPTAVPITVTAISPSTQPVRQWVLALAARWLRLEPCSIAVSLAT
jgi:hypothetical protein